MKLYGISGLGADKRVFDYLTLNCEFIPVEWIKPKRKESIEEYSLRLSTVIDKKEEFGILGVSFGGLVATEISKILKPKLTILISSAETRKELRLLFRGIGKLGLINRLPARMFNPPRRIANFLFGTSKKELLNQILNDTDLNFARWAVNKLVTWKNEKKLVGCFKIHGTKDKLIPPRKTYNMILIEGGEHFMIVDRADEISKIINEKIKNDTIIKSKKL